MKELVLFDRQVTVKLGDRLAVTRYELLVLANAVIVHQIVSMRNGDIVACDTAAKPSISGPRDACSVI